VQKLETQNEGITVLY